MFAATNGQYNAYNFRVVAAIEGQSSESLKDRFATEVKLLRTYGVNLPKLPIVVTPGIPDDVAIYLLKHMDPTALTVYTPMTIKGDGNGLFR